MFSLRSFARLLFASFLKTAMAVVTIMCAAGQPLPEINQLLHCALKHKRLSAVSVGHGNGQPNGLCWPCAFTRGRQHGWFTLLCFVTMSVLMASKHQ